MIEVLDPQARAIPDDSAGPGSATAADLFEQPVPRRFVHRASVAEVLLTGYTADTRPNTYLLAAQWPRGHSFYRTMGGLHDPLLFAETLRQAGLMIGHVGYGVPFENKYVLTSLAYDISFAGLACDGTPSNMILEAEIVDPKFRKETLVGFKQALKLRRGLRVVGVGELETVVVTPAAYKRLRNAPADRPAEPRELPEPVAPALVGKCSAADVVLSPTGRENQWTVRCDTEHPVLFDHPVDHLPGMMIMEAIRQAAHSVLYPMHTVLTDLAAEFEHFAELDEPVEVRAVRQPDWTGSDLRVTVELTQGGRRIASGCCTCRAVY